MGRYVHKFENKSAFEQDIVNKQYMGENERPYVGYLQTEDEVQYNLDPFYKTVCLKFTSSGTFSIPYNGSITAQRDRGKYKLNNSDGMDLPSTELNVSEGDIMFLRGGLDYCTEMYKHYMISGTAEFELSGNGLSISSLSFNHSINDFGNNTTYKYCTIPYRFRDSSIVSAKDFVIKNPLGYNSNLAYNCAFQNCTKLIYGPTLIQTSDFDTINCNSMFSGCTNLKYVKCLFTDLTNAKLASGMYNVSPTGTFVKYPGVEGPRGTSGIPEGWTVLTATE